MTELSAMHPLTIDDVGFMAYIGRILRAREARVYIGAAGLLVETRDVAHAAELRRVMDTHNRESASSVALVITQPEPTSLYVTRAHS